MKYFYTLVILSVFFLSFIAGQTLLFSDEFDTFDLSVWKHEITMSGGGNWEFELYGNNRSSSFVRNSTLFIAPYYTANAIGEDNLSNGYVYSVWGGEPADVCTSNAFYGCERTGGAGGNIINPISSARVRTAESFSFTYGRLEVRAKLPLGDWLWPAIWLLPTTNSYGDWPCSGEIDIVESRGNDASYAAGGINQFSSTLHWGPFWPNDPYTLTHQSYELPEGDFSQDFHVFGLVWSNTSIYTYIDDDSNRVLEVNFNMSFWERGGWTESTFNNPWEGRGVSAPFDQEFFIIFNVAVGGTTGYFPDGVGNKPWKDADPTAVNEFWGAEASQWGPTWNSPALEIDYIKVYSL